MSKKLFKEKMRLNRGRLSSKSAETNMDYIYDNSSASFIGYMESTKKLGLDHAAKITDELSIAEQTELVKWLESKPSGISVSEIDLKVIRIITDR